MSTILPSLVKIGSKILELLCPQTHRLLNFPWFPRFRPSGGGQVENAETTESLKVPRVYLYRGIDSGLTPFCEIFEDNFRYAIHPVVFQRLLCLNLEVYAVIRIITMVVGETSYLALNRVKTDDVILQRD